jgi:gamma-glutamyltranspeptidase/glutathione hydrolase
LGSSKRRNVWLRRIGIALAALVGVLGALAWYVTGLPWRNRCGEAPVPGLASAPGAAAWNSAVATSQPLATRAAAAVLTEGGSAADAAIAAAMVLAVVEPGNSGLGGGGFALVHDPHTGRDVSLDFRERAPLGLDVVELQTALRKNPSTLRDGALAVAVPAEWPGLVQLHGRFGRLPLSRLARPAIDAASNGVAVGRDYSARCWVRLPVLRRDPDARRIFMGAAGLCPFPGWTLRQPELASTLAALTDEGHPASWDERVGTKMVAFLSSKGSRMAAQDLEQASVLERPVVSGHFRGRRIVGMGPPSSGGILVIGLLQSYERMRARFPQANRLHLWTEASRLAFYDRASLLGDPDFVNVPVDRLVSDDYSGAQAQRIGASEPLALPKEVAPAEQTHTTHLSVIDREGMAVALTLSINVPFGSGLVVPGTGVLLNDEMDDFSVEAPNAFGLVGNELNAPAPGKRPLSSMSPTFVYDGDDLAIVLGSPGGSSIPTAVAWVIREMLEDGRGGDDAVHAPRVHDQWVPDVVQVEPRFDRTALPADLVPKTKKPPFPIGRVQMVEREGGSWRGVTDCRDEGESWAAGL